MEELTVLFPKSFIIKRERKTFVFLCFFLWLEKKTFKGFFSSLIYSSVEEGGEVDEAILKWNNKYNHQLI